MAIGNMHRGEDSMCDSRDILADSQTDTGILITILLCHSIGQSEKCKKNSQTNISYSRK